MFPPSLAFYHFSRSFRRLAAPRLFSVKCWRASERDLEGKREREKPSQKKKRFSKPRQLVFETPSHNSFFPSQYVGSYFLASLNQTKQVLQSQNFFLSKNIYIILLLLLLQSGSVIAIQRLFHHERIKVIKRSVDSIRFFHVHYLLA
jgi:hypothetical protein